MSLANKGGNSDASAYPIHENIGRKRFLLFSGVHKCSWSVTLVLLRTCEPADELHWVKGLHIWKDCKQTLVYIA